MATVHEASIEGPDGFSRRVALKRVRPDVAGEEELVRLFSDEARTASHLHHQNLVAILDYGVHEGTPFQVLELVEGTTLAALRAELDARGEAMPEAIAIHIAKEVAHGLAYAHRATGDDGKPLGLVHRDVTPSNVLIGWNGDVKLSDFGIALARGREVQTAHGVTRGKPSYMAPEQATRGTLDARTDLFALGCTLHFALTGRSPLEGDDVLLRMLVGERAPLDPSLAADVRAIVQAAVAPERRERPASADTTIAQLDEAYRARTSRDGRSELRGWLASAGARMRAANTRASTDEAEPARSAAPARRTDTAAATRAERATPPTTRSSTSAWMAASVALAAVLVLSGAWALRETSAAPTVPSAAPDAGLVVDASVPALDAGARALDANDPIDAPVVPSIESPRPHPSIAHTHETEPTPPPSRAPEAVTPPASTPAAGSGWARIVAGCESARGGSVSIDGRDTGEHVPTTARLSSGTHRVRVTAPDGRVFEGALDVDAFDTEGSPAWFRACAAP
jgi:serine/threonine protein kinase